MSEWQPIALAPTDTCTRDVVLWNGKRVFVGWHASDDGWHDSMGGDYDTSPVSPQPTHWQPLPDPPNLNPT